MAYPSNFNPYKLAMPEHPHALTRSRAEKRLDPSCHLYALAARRKPATLMPRKPVLPEEA